MTAENARLQRSAEASAPTPVAGGGLDARAIDKLMEALHDVSTVFLVRFPDSTRSGLKPAEILRQTLEPLLLDPCAVATIPFNASTLATIVTPDAGHAFDPLHIHSLVELLRQGLCERLGIPAESEAASGLLVYPLVRVSSVGMIQENLAALNELLETLVNKRLRVQFQPIVDLTCARNYGFEALIRSPQGGILNRPGALFRTADRARLVSWFDLACQELCFEQAKQSGVREYLFINMDAEGLSYYDTGERSLADRAAEVGIPPSRVVLEITERQTVEDYPRLVHYIEGLRAKGFKIAIDDAGAGYNSLHTISQMRPDFVKIDRSLVRSIENNGARRSLLTTIARYASQIGTAVIAEGIETRDELATIIEAGVTYAQGYLLGKPEDNFKGLRRSMQELINEQMGLRRARLAGRSYAIGTIARRGISFASDTPAEQVATKFEKNPDLESVVIVDEEKIEGLVMRDAFTHACKLDPKALQRPIGDLMDRRPLIVDAETRVEEVATQATFRREMAFASDILVSRWGAYVGAVPIRALMEAMTTLQVNRAKYAHPLTMLPGRVVIEQETNDRLKAEKPTVVAMADIARFRFLNGQYGIAHADEALLATAQILQQAIADAGSPDDFVGHLGADDFVLLLAPPTAEAVCRAVVSRFDEEVPQFYSVEHATKGWIEVTDAEGNLRKAALSRLRLAATGSKVPAPQSFVHAIARLRELMRAVKTDQASGYTIE